MANIGSNDWNAVTYGNGRYAVSYTHLIKLLSRYQDDNFIEALREGLNDAYEMVVRQSAIYAGFVGDDSLSVSYTHLYRRPALK